jgi:hypothetical protein
MCGRRNSGNENMVGEYNANKGRRDLHQDMGQHVTPREVSGACHGDGDGRIEMRASHRPGVMSTHRPQPVADCWRQRNRGIPPVGVHHDARAHHSKQKRRADAFCGELAASCVADVPNLFSGPAAPVWRGRRPAIDTALEYARDLAKFAPLVVIAALVTGLPPQCAVIGRPGHRTDFPAALSQTVMTKS